MVRLREIKVTPNADAIRTFRRICTEIERGDVMSVGFVLVKRGGDISTGWDTYPGDTHKVISGAAILHHRIVSAVDDISE